MPRQSYRKTQPKDSTSDCIQVIEGQINAEGKSFAIALGRFNSFLSEKLQEGAVDCLVRHGASPGDITLVRVPGAYELPQVCLKLAQSQKYAGVIALGVVIRGATPHFDYVASEAAKGVAAVGLETGIPVIFGVITADTIEQAVERAGTKSGNKGWDAAMAAMEMADLVARLED